METMYYQQLDRSSYKDSVRVLESDIQRANAMAAELPRAKNGVRIQMKLMHNQLAPFFLLLLRWIDCSCSCFLPRYLNLFHILIYKVYTDGRPKVSANGRKASVREFYAVILPSLQQLHSEFVEQNSMTNEDLIVNGRGMMREIIERDNGIQTYMDSEREEECGICLEPCTKMVTPNCCHAMCINCYRDWSTRSLSCPFCRGTLKRVRSSDLWVLTNKDDVIDPDKVSKEDLRRFYLYIRNLPKDSPEAIFLIYYEYLF